MTRRRCPARSGMAQARLSPATGPSRRLSLRWRPRRSVPGQLEVRGHALAWMDGPGPGRCGGTADRPRCRDRSNDVHRSISGLEYAATSAQGGFAASRRARSRRLVGNRGPHAARQLSRDHRRCLPPRHPPGRNAHRDQRSLHARYGQAAVRFHRVRQPAISRDRRPGRRGSWLGWPRDRHLRCHADALPHGDLRALRDVLRERQRIAVAGLILTARSL